MKQLISLVCWFVPPTKLSISTRGSTFLWLDTLAKWSMVDIFVMFVSMVSFKYVGLSVYIFYVVYVSVSFFNHCSAFLVTE